MNEKKIEECVYEEWMYDFAWKLRDIAQQGNNILDTKAMNVISFSSILIPIITGILLYITDKSNYPSCIGLLLVGSIVSLIITIFFAFVTVWIRDYGILPINDHFKACGSDNIDDVLFHTSKDIAVWQKQILEVGNNKSKYFKRSSYFFILALFLMLSSAILVFLPHFHDLSILLFGFRGG